MKPEFNKTRQKKPGLLRYRSRRHRRYPVEGVCGTLLPSTPATLLNLSRSGLAVEVPEPLVVGESCLLRFQHGGRNATMELRIAWCRRCRGRWRLFGGPGTTFLAGGTIVDLYRDAGEGLWEGLQPEPRGELRSWEEGGEAPARSR